MKTVTIKRSKWGTQALKNSKGKFCCLGFCALSAGIPSTELRGVAMPDELGDLEPLFQKAFPRLNYNACASLAEINDSRQPKPVKEAALKKELRRRKLPLRFRFVD